MMIKSIQIKNVRGIGDAKKFDVNMKPNRPVFFVAPNGFGKSSISAAFNSLDNRNRINVSKKNFHRGNQELESEVAINFNDTFLTSNNQKNEILREFEIKVINNPTYPNVRRKRLESGFNVETGELKVPDVIIIKKIPEKKYLIFIRLLR